MESELEKAALEKANEELGQKVKGLEGLSKGLEKENLRMHNALNEQTAILKSASKFEQRHKKAEEQRVKFLVKGLQQQKKTKEAFDQLKLQKQEKALRVKNRLLHLAKIDLKKDHHEMQKNYKKIKELEKFRTKFFENITHELRTPLTLIIGPLQSLMDKDTELPESDLEALRLAHKNSQKLLRLINQLLELSKINAGKIGVEARLLDLVECIKKFAMSFNSALQQKDLEFTLNSDSASISCYFDPLKLEQIFFNLISNAIKMTPSGGKITLSIQEPVEIEYPSSIPICDLLVFAKKESHLIEELKKSFKTVLFTSDLRIAESMLLSYKVKSFFLEDPPIEQNELMEILDYCQEVQSDTYLAMKTNFSIDFDLLLKKDLINRVISDDQNLESILGLFKGINKTKPWQESHSRKFVTVTLEDTGAGISDHQVDNIFKRFSKAGNENINPTGSGLGLNIVKEYLDMHHCNVQVLSKEGKGSKFQITIPLGDEHLDPKSVASIGFGNFDPYQKGKIEDRREERTLMDAEKMTFNDKWGTPRRLSDRMLLQSSQLENSSLDLVSPKKVLLPENKKLKECPKVLVIDDNWDMLKFISGLLKENYQVHCVSNGQEGWKKTIAMQPDLILCDLIMPGMTGADLLAKVKSSQLTSHIPFIILTAKITDFYELDDLSEVDSFLSKPFNPKELLLRVENVLKFKRQQKQLEQLNKDLTEKVLKRYLSPDLIEGISNGKIKINDSPRSLPITVIFTDLKNFTKNTLSLSPRRMGKLINDFFEMSIDLIFKHGGTVDKLIGDSVMAFFGAPQKQTPKFQVNQAIKCAVEMQKGLKELNRKWAKENYSLFEMRIGIHHGIATVGNFGNKRRQDYTAFGKTINLASRLEGHCPPGNILISEEVSDIYQGKVKDFGELTIKGFNKKVHCFSLEIEE
uniref:histidine kinase n=1 Tax=Uncultured bacterium HF130_AEPn_1 TaxID=663362 RepID=D0E8K1_UNCHF|nr:adenylate cyclase family 3 [uncultured bacterium HF130_AEPn_1]